MEVLKKNIHMYRQAKRAVSQITLEEDFNVPDAKPDGSPDNLQDLPVLQDLLRRHPGSTLGRQAVAAAEIAAIRHRNPHIVNLPAEAVQRFVYG